MMKLSGLMAATALGLALSLGGGAIAQQQQQGPATAATQPDEATVKGAGQRAADAGRELQAAARAMREAGDNPTDQTKQQLEQALDKLDQALVELAKARGDSGVAQQDVQRLRDEVGKHRQQPQQSAEALAALESLGERSQRVAREGAAASTGGTQVGVQQKPAEVEVDSKSPQVTVRQPKPEVEVIIRQPKPEVTVTQPKPEVTVKQAEPEVTVKQEEPKVTVTEVDVGDRSAAGTGKAGDRQADASPSSAETAPKPMGSANPSKSAADTGRGADKPAPAPTQADAGTADGKQGAAGATADTAGGTSADTATRDAAGDDKGGPAGAAAAGQATGAAAVDKPAEKPWYAGMKAEDLIGKPVTNQVGDDVSEIDALVRDPDGKVYAVLSVGGFLGIGDKQVLVPLDEMKLADDEVVLMSEQDEQSLQNLSAYDDGRQDYQKIEDDQALPN